MSIEIIKLRQRHNAGKGYAVYVNGTPDSVHPTREAAADRAAELSKAHGIATMERWLSDGESWIGVFQNHDLGHSQFGQRIALCFDVKVWDKGEIGKTKAPDTSYGPGFRFILKAKCKTVAEAQAALEGKDPVQPPVAANG